VLQEKKKSEKKRRWLDGIELIQSFIYPEREDRKTTGGRFSKKKEGALVQNSGGGKVPGGGEAGSASEDNIPASVRRKRKQGPSGGEGG